MVKFKKQQALARSHGWARNRINRRSFKEKRSYDKKTVTKLLDSSNFSDFSNRAYAADYGYSIRDNKTTGQKEMFVAGTRNSKQWFLNAVDTAAYAIDNRVIPALEFVGLPYAKKLKHFKKIDPWRLSKQKFYSNIAKEKGVDVIFGHSRGAAIVADMDVGGQKIGLDGAMIFAKNKKIVNYNQGGHLLKPKGYFDYIIGFSGKQNVYLDRSGGAIHKVWKV